MNNTKRLATIDFILSKVPKFECRDGCSDCCGPIVMSRLEMRRIIERTGLTEKDLDFMTVIKRPDHTCPLLDQKTNRCTVYDIRPAICRVFGSGDHPKLQCKHGCKPQNPWSRERVDATMDKVAEIGHGVPAHASAILPALAQLI